MRVFGLTVLLRIAIFLAMSSVLLSVPRVTFLSDAMFMSFLSDILDRDMDWPKSSVDDWLS